MANWYAPTTNPRIHLGRVSDWNFRHCQSPISQHPALLALTIGTWTETKPTPIPAKKRPAMNVDLLNAPVCNATPRLNGIIAEVMIPHLRPSLSATIPAIKAPTNVPTERIETMREISPEGGCSLGPRFGKNCCCQAFISWIPEIVPTQRLVA